MTMKMNQKKNQFNQKKNLQLQQNQKPQQINTIKIKIIKKIMIHSTQIKKLFQKNQLKN